MIKKVLFILMIISLLTCVASAAKDVSKNPTVIDEKTKIQNEKFQVFKSTETELLDNIIYIDLKDSKQKFVSSTKYNEPGNKLSDHYSLYDTKCVFHSWSDNFVTTHVIGCNVYLKDLETGDLTLISEHARMPTISDDGKYVVYEYEDNFDDDLMPILQIYDANTGQKKSIAYTTNGRIWISQIFRINNSVIYFKSSAYSENLTEMSYDLKTDKLEVVVL